MADRWTTIALGFGGEYVAGDSGAIPNGYVRLLQNYLPRPNRVPSRPPFLYDSLMSVTGLVNFDDTTNNVTRLISIDTGLSLYEKSATMNVETWSGSIAGAAVGVRVTDFANYGGVLYGMLDNGSGLPGAAFSFDGTNVSAAPFNSSIIGRTITTFIDRLFIAYPRDVVAPNSTSPTVNTYDWTGINWRTTNLTVAMTTLATGVQVCRLSPTSTAVSGCSVIYNTATSPATGLISIAASPTTYKTQQWRGDFRGVDSLYNVPVTLELVLYITKIGLTPYAVGDIISGANGYRYRCTVAGTTGAAVALNTVVGGTTVDGTVTWLCEGSDILGALEDVVTNVTDQPTYLPKVLNAVIPPHHNTIAVTPRLKFYNTTNTALTTLAPIDISLKDGLTDGDHRKRNYGQQWTLGDYYYPFFNCETATSATIDSASIVWSETSDPKTIRAANNYRLQEAAGYPTAAIVASDRYIVFKRNATYIFAGTADPNNPIVREDVDIDIGCLGPRALDKYEDEIFSIGESDVYRRMVGNKAKPFCGDGMREAIMAKGSTWVEAQSTYKRPLLAIDKKQLVVWVYTQKSKLYAFDLRANIWSEHTMPNSAEVDAMLWNPNTGNFYVSFGGFGLTRMDYATAATTGAKDTIDNTVNTYSATTTVIFRPLELSDPGRYDAVCDSIHLYHAATASQSGQTITVSYSFDQGATYPRTATVSLAALSASGEYVALPLPTRQKAPSITIKLTTSGRTGEAVWTLSPRAYVKLKLLRGEYPAVNPTPVSGSL